MIEYAVLGQAIQNLPVNRGEIRLCWTGFQISGKKTRVEIRSGGERV